MTNLLEVQFLGFPTVYLNKTAVSLSAKSTALLAYLILEPRPHARHALASLLWGEMGDSDARRNLRGEIMRLRRALGGDYIGGSSQTAVFIPPTRFACDLTTFIAAKQQTVTAPLQAALDLYRGEFLQELVVRHAPDFDHWLQQQRTRFQQTAVSLYDTLTQQQLQQGQTEAGLAATRRWLALDPLREAAHRRYMILLAQDGQRSVALAHYDSLTQLLRDELSVEPSPKTAALAQQLRTPIPQPQQAPTTEYRTPNTPNALPLPQTAPFIVGPPLTHPATFYGRQRQLRRLFGLLQRPPLQNAAIIGPRRSGKTSLLHHLRTLCTTPPSQLRLGQRHDWLPNAARYRWPFIDFQDTRYGEPSYLLASLLEQLGLPVPEDCQMEQFMEIVADELAEPAVVLLDEIGVALERYPQLDDAFWESLRSLASHQVGGQLAFVLASTHSPADLAQHSGLGSPFFNIFGYTATLGPFTEAEAQAFIADLPVPTDDETAAFLLNQSGRWPILLQILCREFVDAYQHQLLDDPDWQADALQQLAPFRQLIDDQ